MAFYSKKLSPAEQNYDIGNQELLAVKLVQEELRHRMEGAAYPFMIFTAHKNLEYLKAAKCLNTCQAWWALFFAKFFILSYWPGSKNIKAVSLYRAYSTENKNQRPETTSPPLPALKG